MSRGTRRALPSLLGFLVVAVGFPLAAPPPAAAASSALFFSEYVEGSSNNKALEIFNGTGATVNLSGYSVQMAFNGSPTPALTINLNAVTLAAGEVFVLAQSSADSAVLDSADQTNAAGWYNGDDAVLLRNGTTVIDSIGQAGVDPGTEWGSGLASTADNTLRRKASITDGDTNASDAFDPTIQWDGFATNTFDGLGFHGADAAPSVLTTSPSNGAGGVVVDANITIDFSEAVNVSSASFAIDCASSGVHTAALSGSGDSYTLDPDADFAELEECDVTVVAGQVADEDGADPPDNMAADHAFSFTTEGDVCNLSFTPTYQIQGSGTSAAITGAVTTEGVIVGDFEGPTNVGLQGFFIQDPTGDGDSATSDGLFIFTNLADNGLNVGDVVRVSGAVSEFNGQTQVSGTAPGAIVPCGTAELPAVADVNLPQATPTYLERYEGMRTRFPQTLVISEYFEYEQFGEIVLGLPHAGEDRLFTPTHLEEPETQAYQDRLSLNQRSQIRLNDGLGNSNPLSLRHPNGNPFSLANRFRGGDTVANTVGILSERTATNNPFPRYRMEPTGPADYSAVNAREAAPDPVGGSTQVAAMNTLNYFLTADFPSGNVNDNKCGPLQNVECRGHDSVEPNELSRQRAKLLAALSGLGAEVIGLNEVENTPGVDPVGDIVAGLNAIEGVGTYAYIDTGVIGTDAIRVGLIYRKGAVTPLGAFQILDSSDDPRFIDTLNRPVLAQTFRVNANGAVFTVAVNHLKSKNASPACLRDSGDGQGSCSEVREAAAAALVDWLATDPTGSDDPDFLIVGDLNSYAKEDPIDAARAGSDGFLGTGDDFTNLIEKYMGDHAYSYTFDSMVGYLDHALATSSLEAQVTGATEWHINADEPDVFDYDTSFKPETQEALYEPNAFRSSDHDPVIVGLNLTPAAGKVTGSGTWVDGTFEIAVQFVPGATTPSGSTTLSVPTGTLAASGFDWLTVRANRAVFQGVGTLNGNPGYGFVVSVLDGGSPVTKDRIRIRIWDAGGVTVYDSQPGASVTTTPTTQPTSGNIVVHKLK